MPKGIVRYPQCGCFHFLTFGCHHLLPHLGTSAARDLFERSLETMRLRYDFVVCVTLDFEIQRSFLSIDPEQLLRIRELSRWSGWTVRFQPPGCQYSSQHNGRSVRSGLARPRKRFG
jgi:hypothetical protein